jgi:hypothetical protein
MRPEFFTGDFEGAEIEELFSRQRSWAGPRCKHFNRFMVQLSRFTAFLAASPLPVAPQSISGVGSTALCERRAAWKCPTETLFSATLAARGYLGPATVRAFAPEEFGKIVAGRSQIRLIARTDRCRAPRAAGRRKAASRHSFPRTRHRRRTGRRGPLGNNGS